jgi:hypothetical protein
MENRGIMPSVVENTITNGISREIIEKGIKNQKYYDPINNISVIVNANKVITTGHGVIRRY